MVQVRRNIHPVVQYFDVFERTEQTEHKSANEIYLLDIAIQCLYAYLIFITLERCVFFYDICTFYYVNYSSINCSFNEVVVFLKVKDFHRVLGTEL